MTKNGRHDLVGTSEAAEILGVEKPRIGRWIHSGRMPEPVCRLNATPVWLRADVEALGESIKAVKAAKAAKQSKPEMRVKPSRPLDLVGTREAAELLGVERTRIGRWLRSGRMPEPLVRLNATPIWLRADVVKLAKRLAKEREQRERKRAVAS